ncbi:TPA: type II secretion system major pseudopilin GspG, partial [Escherichia coli]
ALDMYKLDNHHYPTTNQGLESLVEAPTLPPLAANYNKEGYIKRLPADPWGNDYVLVNPGEHGAYDLLSAGPDGEMGTEDDITNWGLSKKKK